MAKIHKATVYYIDHEDSEDKESFKGELSEAIRNSYLGRAALIVDASSTKKFEWDDDIDINNINADKDTFEKYFTKEITMETVFGIRKDVWEQMVLPALALKIDHNEPLKALVIVEDCNGINKLVQLYKEKMGDSWRETRIDMDDFNHRGSAVIGKEECYYVTSPENIDTIYNEMRGFRFNQIIFTKA